ncbi:MAG: DUF499 domain-containing protein [Synergistaceae bacterium]|jgi:predicted AAA+ superfamily ATPase|nr:DUF499 domain-containing protein [Synergistaceae bacterium]
MSLKPWREVVAPHEDVLRGTFQQAEFAADLSRVHAGTAATEYQNPALFFQRTFITEGMRLLLYSVVKRLTGMGGDPVIQLQTAFGGGKTHTMLAVYHIARGEVPASELFGVSAILDGAGVVELPRARVVVLDGIDCSPNQPFYREKQEIKTLWGNLAWQLGGPEGFKFVADADASGTSPGKATLEKLLSKFSPCVILIDELVAYIRQFEAGHTLTGGTFDSNLSFVQALTEAIKGVTTAVMLVSLPESNKEAGGQQGVAALDTLSRYFGRIQALWKPVGSEEAFEIVRRRLFTKPADKASAIEVCRAFEDYYVANGDSFPKETQEGRYFDRLMSAYPIHPEVFDRLYEDWSSFEHFQRTRGVLKLMAKVIHRLWIDNDKDLLLMPGSLPLHDPDARNEMLYYLPQGWDPVVERDVDGAKAETTEIEKRDTRLGSVQACRRAARTIFLGSAPSTANKAARGVETERIILGTAQPEQQIGLYRDALRRLEDRLHYLNNSNNRFWFDTRPNLRREMEERKRRFKYAEDLLPVIRDRLQKSLNGGIFGGIHVFTAHGDIPDDMQLRLVVLPVEASCSRSGHGHAEACAVESLKNHGTQPRFRQNRLIFLAAAEESVEPLKDHVRSVLAWQSIVEDVKALKLNLDQFEARNASKSLENTENALRQSIRETYKWIMAPMQQEARNGNGLSEIQWEKQPLNPSAGSYMGEIERLLKENELLISAWAPIHLLTMLKRWFWKGGLKEAAAQNVWQQSCQQLYLPRLKDEGVFKRAMEDGSESRDFFGFARGNEDEHYIGFSFGKKIAPVFDGSLLLIEPSAAANYEESDCVRQEALKPHKTDSVPCAGGGQNTTVTTSVTAAVTGSFGETKKESTKKFFYGRVKLDSFTAKKQFSDIVDEVVQQFTSRSNVKVSIVVNIEAETASMSGFDSNMQRSVRENCDVLGFREAEFEKGDE